MILPDANVLVYAFREDAPRHADYREWLQGVVNGEAAFALSSLVLAGFIRMVTHPGLFTTPSSVRDALAFATAVASPVNRVEVAPGPRHFHIFSQLCEKASVRGNRIHSAYLAALAIESGCEWLTSDRDYGRFPGLHWRHPLDSANAR